MKGIKATYKNGKVTLAEKPPVKGPVNVLVVFPEETDDPWQAILNEKTPRRAFLEYVEECRKEIARGKAKPLRLDQL